MFILNEGAKPPRCWVAKDECCATSDALKVVSMTVQVICWGFGSHYKLQEKSQQFANAEANMYSEYSGSCIRYMTPDVSTVLPEFLR